MRIYYPFAHFCGGGKYRRLFVWHRWGYDWGRGSGYRAFFLGPLHVGWWTREKRMSPEREAAWRAYGKRP